MYNIGIHGGDMMDSINSGSIINHFYQEFLSLIDSESRTKLQQLDTVIADNVDKINQDGWRVHRSSVMKRLENGVDTCVLDRNIDGYYISPAPVTNLHIDESNQETQDFMSRRENELLSLHLAFRLKDEYLFHRQYQVAEGDADKVDDIHSLLGFQYLCSVPTFLDELRSYPLKVIQEFSHYFTLLHHADELDILPDEFYELQEILRTNPLAQKMDHYHYLMNCGKMDENLYQQVLLAYFSACYQCLYPDNKSQIQYFKSDDHKN